MQLHIGTTCRAAAMRLYLNYFDHFSEIGVDVCPFKTCWYFTIETINEFIILRLMCKF